MPLFLRLEVEAEAKKLRCFYIGSTQNTLDLINRKLSNKYQNVSFGFFSPPFKNEFSDIDNMIVLNFVEGYGVGDEYSAKEIYHLVYVAAEDENTANDNYECFDSF